jgi:adenosylmethionine-8-amino-7-oxononanoate aminotransferase
MSPEELIAKDQQNIWHPLTQHKTADLPKAISRASGNYLFDIEGKTYYDAISSWYTCSYGHANPFLTNAVKNQLDKLHHVVFAGMTHEPAVELSEKLLKILPHNQSKLFFSENGSTSVEIALKMAFQYFFNRGEKRDTIVAFESGFHGDTFGAMSASGLSVYNGAFEDFFIKVKRIPVPDGSNNEQVLKQLDEIIQNNKVAAFIYEPLVQGAAGMKMYDAEGLCRLLLRFRESGILSIADEVMTGFGKTGKNFASDHLLNKPDIICLSKALTGGIMPMAITSCSQKVYDAFYDDELSKGLFHGHTYSGNPLGCAASIAAIDLLKSDKIQRNVQRIEQQHIDFIDQQRGSGLFKSMRCTGTILAFELNKQMDRYGSQRNAVFEWFWKQRIFLRPLGATLYTVPPFTSTRKDLENLYALFIEFAESFN